MPYTAGAFVMFGLGSLPAGRLGDLWGRRAMMIVFFLGMGVAAMLIALTGGVWSLAAALTLMGVFASIYHPVGIPMLVQQSKNPGFTIGVNGLAGNLGHRGRRDPDRLPGQVRRLAHRLRGAGRPSRWCAAWSSPSSRRARRWRRPSGRRSRWTCRAR